MADPLLLGPTMSFVAATAYATAVAATETDLIGEPFGLRRVRGWPLREPEQSRAREPHPTLQA